MSSLHDRRRVVGAILVVVLAACGSGGQHAGKHGGTTTTTVKFSGESSARFCALDRDFHTQFDLLTTSALPSQLAAKLPAAVSALQGMETAASHEIRPSVTLLRERIQKALPLLAAVGYDPSKLDAAARARYAKVADKTSAAASTRLAAYEQQVCAKSTK